MSTIKKLRRQGNNSAIPLDKATMQYLGLKDGGEVLLTLTANSLVITTVNDKTMPQDVFEKVSAKVVAKNTPLLKRLAKR